VTDHLFVAGQEELPAVQEASAVSGERPLPLDAVLAQRERARPTPARHEPQHEGDVLIIEPTPLDTLLFHRQALSAQVLRLVCDGQDGAPAHPEQAHDVACRRQVGEGAPRPRRVEGALRDGLWGDGVRQQAHLMHALQEHELFHCR
jgi:hypothetical protein